MLQLTKHCRRRLTQAATSLALVQMTCIAGLHSMHLEAADKARKHRTTLSVSGDRADAVRGFLLRELHDMPNIEIVAEKDATIVNPSAFDISVVTLDIKAAGQTTGIAFSAVVVGPFDRIDKHILRTVPARDGVRAACEEFAAEFGGYVHEWEQVKLH